MFTRALIVLLLILNLGVAAWWLLRPAPPPPEVPAHPQGVQKLQLSSELAPKAGAQLATIPAAREVGATTDPEADSPAPPQDAPVVGETAPIACYSFGPFADTAAAGAARQALPAGTTRVRTRSADGGASGFWNVLIRAQTDRAAAQALAERIDAAGFKDYYLIGEGASANGIALGRFGNEEAALRHQAALQAAGFPARIQGPAATGAVWVDVAAGAQFDPTAARTAMGAAQQQALACGELG